MSLAMETLQAPALGLPEQVRIAHNRSELHRVFPHSRSYVEKFGRFRPYDIVIKVGGRMVENTDLLNGLVVMQDHGLNPVIVHGGGDQIDEAIQAAGEDLVEKDKGKRPTPPEHVEHIYRALEGVNQSICAEIDNRGGRTIGIAGIFKGIPHDPANVVIDRVLEVDTEPVIRAAYTGKIAVVNCIGQIIDSDERANLNADNAAAALAAALGVEKFISVMDMEYVQDENGHRISKILTREVWDLKKKGVIKGGMVEKVDKAAELTCNGVHDVVLTRDPMRELFTEEGAGTIVHRYE
jgi:acetylglutamate kinase